MRWLAIARVVPLVLYPFAVYLALGRVDARYIGMALVGLLLLRYRSRLGGIAAGMQVVAATVVGIFILYAAVVWWTNDEHVLRLYPALINAGMLCVFGWTLYRPPTMIERFARLQHGDIGQDGIRYTATVTRIWCAFFFLNSAIAAYTAFAASRAVWVLYNGLIAYLLMGVLLLGEWLIRRRVLQKAAAS